MPGVEERRQLAPAVPAGVVRLDGVERLAATLASDDEDLVADDRDGEPATRRRQRRGALVPHAAPEVEDIDRVGRGVDVDIPAPDRVEPVSDDSRLEVVAHSGHVREARPAVRVRVVDVDPAHGVAVVEPAEVVDPAVVGDHAAGTPSARHRRPRLERVRCRIVGEHRVHVRLGPCGQAPDVVDETAELDALDVVDRDRQGRRVSPPTGRRVVDLVLPAAACQIEAASGCDIGDLLTLAPARLQGLPAAEPVVDRLEDDDLAAAVARDPDRAREGPVVRCRGDVKRHCRHVGKEPAPRRAPPVGSDVDPVDGAVEANRQQVAPQLAAQARGAVLNEPVGRLLEGGQGTALRTRLQPVALPGIRDRNRRLPILVEDVRAVASSWIRMPCVGAFGNQVEGVPGVGARLPALVRTTGRALPGGNRAPILVHAVVDGEEPSGLGQHEVVRIPETRRVDRDGPAGDEPCLVFAIVAAERIALVVWAGAAVVVQRRQIVSPLADRLEIEFQHRR